MTTGALASRLLRSVRHRDYRLFLTAQAVSVLGTWMQNVAQAWLVYRLTGSSFMLGLVSFAGLLPILLVGLWGGVVADRVSRHRLTLVTHGAALVLALTLAVLTLTDRVAVWHVLVLAFLLGITHAFGLPARHSFIAQLVPKGDLPNAIALHSTVFNSARFLGPTLAGWVVLVADEGVVFALNALSYGVFLVLVSRIPAVHQPPPGAGSAWGRMREGLGHAWRDRGIRSVLFLIALAGFLGSPYVVLMPVFADEVFAGGPETLGLLVGAAGAGSLAGALMLAQRADAGNLDRILGGAGVAAGIGLLAFSALDSRWLAFMVLPVVGFSLTTLGAGGNTLIQLLVPDALRGRVVSLFSVTFLGLAPLGNLLSGSLAEVLGVQTTVALLGGLCLAGALAYLGLAPRAEPA